MKDKLHIQNKNCNSVCNEYKYKDYRNKMSKAAEKNYYKEN